MNKKPDERGEAFKYCRTGPRNYTGLYQIDDLYTVQDYLQENGQQELADMAQVARLMLKAEHWVLSYLQKAELLEPLLDFVWHEDRELYDMLLEQWDGADEVANRPRLKVVDDGTDN